MSLFSLEEKSNQKNQGKTMLPRQTYRTPADLPSPPHLHTKHCLQNQLMTLIKVQFGKKFLTPVGIFRQGAAGIQQKSELQNFPDDFSAKTLS
ncbi:MAG: hypothetical protein ACKVQB_01555 [Bacteroidia bacterium]